MECAEIENNGGLYMNTSPFKLQQRYEESLFELFCLTRIRSSIINQNRIVFFEIKGGVSRIEYEGAMKRAYSFDIHSQGLVFIAFIMIPLYEASRKEEN